VKIEDVEISLDVDKKFELPEFTAVEDANLKSVEVRDGVYLVDRIPIRRSTIMSRTTPLK